MRTLASHFTSAASSLKTLKQKNIGFSCLSISRCVMDLPFPVATFIATSHTSLGVCFLVFRFFHWSYSPLKWGEQGKWGKICSHSQDGGQEKCLHLGDMIECDSCCSKWIYKARPWNENSWPWWFLLMEVVNWLQGWKTCWQTRRFISMSYLALTFAGRKVQIAPNWRI